MLLFLGIEAVLAGMPATKLSETGSAGALR